VRRRRAPADYWDTYPGAWRDAPAQAQARREILGAHCSSSPSATTSPASQEEGELEISDDGNPMK
jgi:hypothetical protein